MSTVMPFYEHIWNISMSFILLCSLSEDFCGTIASKKLILNTYSHDFTSKFCQDTTSFWIIIDWALLVTDFIVLLLIILDR